MKYRFRLSLQTEKLTKKYAGDIERRQAEETLRKVLVDRGQEFKYVRCCFMVPKLTSAS